MGIRLLGKQKLHSKEKDADYYLIHIDFPSPDGIEFGRHCDKKFVSKEVYDSVVKEMFGAEIDFEWAFNGRFPSIKSIKILKKGGS